MRLALLHALLLICLGATNARAVRQSVSFDRKFPASWCAFPEGLTFQADRTDVTLSFRFATCVIDEQDPESWIPVTVRIDNILLTTFDIDVTHVPTSQGCYDCSVAISAVYDSLAQLTGQPLVELFDTDPMLDPGNRGWDLSEAGVWTLGSAPRIPLDENSGTGGSLRLAGGGGCPDTVTVSVSLNGLTPGTSYNLTGWWSAVPTNGDCSPSTSGLSQWLRIIAESSAEDPTLLLVPSEYPAINDAIAACTDGDTVRVAAGTYPEDVLVDGVSILLESESGASATTVQSVTWQNAQSSTVSSLDGFTITGSLNVANTWDMTAGSCVVMGDAFISADVDAHLVGCNVVGSATVETGDGPASALGCTIAGSLAVLTNGFSVQNQASVSGCDVAGSGSVLSSIDAYVTDSSFGAVLNAAADHVTVGTCTAMSFDVDAHATSALVIDCTSTGGDTDISSEGSATLQDCVLAGDAILRSGSVTAEGNVITGHLRTPETGNVVLSRNSVVGNGTAGAGLELGALTSLTAERNLVVGFDVGVEITSVGPTTLICNDVFDCGIAWSGVSDPTGVDGNIAVDPLLCNVVGADYRLQSGSPCLPGNHPDGSSCAVIGAVSDTCAAATMSDRMYWADWQSDVVRAATLEGADVESVLTFPSNAVVRRLAIDSARGYLYFADENQNTISRSRLDGQSLEAIHGPLPPGYDPNSVAIDVYRDRVYWGDRGQNRIRYGSTDGTGAIATLADVDVSYPVELAVDPLGSYLYWTDRGLGRIARVDLLGGGVPETVVGSLDDPRGLALDLDEGAMYWTEAGTRSVKRAALDGSGVETLFVLQESEAVPEGIALDLRERRLYLTDSGGSGSKRIFGAPMTVDPDVDTLLVTDPAHVPWGLALAFAPDAPSEEVSGFLAVGAPEAVRLYWTNPTSADFRGTVIRWKEGPEPPIDVYDGEELVFFGADTTTSIVHTGLVNGNTYSYRICSRDVRWQTSVGVTATATPDPVGVADVPPAHAFTVRSVPNPYRSTVTLLLDGVDDVNTLDVRVFDAVGRLVRVLDVPLAGARAVRWDGRDDGSRRVAAGIYFARVMSGPEQRIVRIVRVE